MNNLWTLILRIDAVDYKHNIHLHGILDYAVRLYVLTDCPFFHHGCMDAINSRQSPEAGSVGEERGQAGQQQQPAPQRQIVVRRFQIAFQLDLLLILKLAAVIFLFNQDGSRQRLVALVFFASLVYL
jgi:hypothetical protein